MLDKLEKPLLHIAHLIKKHGGRALLVGGCVRDFLLGQTPKDYDIEVFGLGIETLEKILSQEFKILKVGKAFGVFKIRDHEIDISLPRKESKSGQGHKGFHIHSDPHLSLEEAASRRDFTINAIFCDPLTQEIIDPFNGHEDLKQKTLRHVSNKFSEDPLRVLRAMQFIGRFEFTIAAETLDLCKKITPENLPKERIFDEWAKLILKSKKPSLGLQFLKESGWIQHYPQLVDLVDCKQDPIWHPEGDVWVHTLHCLDDFAKDRINNTFEDLVVGLAVLCHDFGKPCTTYTDEDGRIRSPKHELKGVPIAEAFLRQLTDHQELINSVLILVECHGRPYELIKNKSSDAAIRRLIHKVQRIDRLIRVCSADNGGSPPKTKDEFNKGLKWLYERIELLGLKDSAPKPLLKGRDLIHLGMQPSPEFSKILNECFEAQLEGLFHTKEEGLKFLKALLQKNN